MIAASLLLFLPLLAGAQPTPPDSLVCDISAAGGARCKVVVGSVKGRSWSARVGSYPQPVVPVHILLPFEVRNFHSIAAPEDLLVSLKTIPRKYSVLTVFIPHAGRAPFEIELGSDVPVKKTGDGKLRLDFDLAFRGASTALDAVRALPTAISSYDLTVTTPREFADTEVASDSGAPFRRDPTNRNAFVCKASELSKNGFTSWFAYPDLGLRIEKYYVVAVSIILGLIGTFGLVSPFRNRNTGRLAIVFFIGVAATATAAASFVLISLESFLNVAAIAAPAVPLAIVSGLMLIWVYHTRDRAVQIEGKVLGSEGALRSANVWLKRQCDGSSEWLLRSEVVELETDGRFLFKFVRSTNYSYQIVVKKDDYELVTRPVTFEDGTSGVDLGNIQLTASSP